MDAILYTRKMILDEPQPDPINTLPKVLPRPPKVEPTAVAAAVSAPIPAPACAISIDASRVGASYRQFSELMSKGQATIKFMEFTEQKAQNGALLEQMRAARTARGELDSSARYQRVASVLPPRDALFAMDPASLATQRQNVHIALGECDEELRYLYHLYIDECLDVEIARVRDVLMKLA